MATVIGDRLDCRNNIRASVGDAVTVFLPQPPNHEDYVLSSHSEPRDEFGCLHNVIGHGVVDEAGSERCAVQINRLASK